MAAQRKRWVGGRRVPERAERRMRVVCLWRVLRWSRSWRETKNLESGFSACVGGGEQPVNGAGYLQSSWGVGGYHMLIHSLPCADTGNALAVDAPAQ